LKLFNIRAPGAPKAICIAPIRSNVNRKIDYNPIGGDDARKSARLFTPGSYCLSVSSARNEIAYGLSFTVDIDRKRSRKKKRKQNPPFFFFFKTVPILDLYSRILLFLRCLLVAAILFRPSKAEKTK
jgi:hypothetical protein